MHEHPLANRTAKWGRFEPVWTLEIQTLPDDVHRLLDAVDGTHPLRYGIYERNASISAPGVGTSRPPAGSTTVTHLDDFEAGQIERYPFVDLKISFERDPVVLERIMDAVLYAHAHEEPTIFLRKDWASRANYDPGNDNPNRWWNNGRGIPEVADA